MATRRGDTLIFPKPPVIAAHACIGGKKEGEGPLAACFDELSADNFFGQSNWEAAEKEMALRAAKKRAKARWRQSSMSCTVTTASGRPAGRPLKRSCNYRRRGSA